MSNDNDAGLSISGKLQALAAAEVDDMAGVYGRPEEPFNHCRYADDLERQLAAGGVGYLDPPDVNFWRVVVAELRRRGRPLLMSL